MSKIYKYIKGVKVELSAQAVKREIIKAQGWTEAQYKSEYNIIRNKLRNYEKYMRESGADVQPQSVQQFLYFESKRKLEGSYTPSIKMRAIQSFSAQSTGKKIGTKTRQRMGNIITKATNERFAGLINANPKAREIAESIKDPVLRERALADFANKLHIKIKASGVAESKSAIPFGQKVGSTEPIDFDYSSYLE